MTNSSRMQATDPSIANQALVPIAKPSTDSVLALRQKGSSNVILKAISDLTAVPYRAIEVDDKLTFLKQYGGSSLAYSSLQAGLDYYLLPDNGYIAYSLIGDAVPLCLADPICSITNTQELLKNFLTSYKQPMFFHVSKNVAQVLSQIGFSINEVGTETIIDLQRFNLKGTKKEFLRHQVNLGKREGLVIKEQSYSKIGENILETISEKWLQKKVVYSHELSFIVKFLK